ncbi:MAG: hypothetical protein ACLUTU_18095 [Blautia faecis]
MCPIAIAPSTEAGEVHCYSVVCCGSW